VFADSAEHVYVGTMVLFAMFGEYLVGYGALWARYLVFDAEVHAVYLR